MVYNLTLLIQFIEYGKYILEEVAFYYDTELNSADVAILRERAYYCISYCFKWKYVLIAGDAMITSLTSA